jgi:hypothetical protein
MKPLISIRQFATCFGCRPRGDSRSNALSAGLIYNYSVLGHQDQNSPLGSRCHGFRDLRALDTGQSVAVGGERDSTTYRRRRAQAGIRSDRADLDRQCGYRYADRLERAYGSTGRPDMPGGSDGCGREDIREDANRAHYSTGGRSCAGVRAIIERRRYCLKKLNRLELHEVLKNCGGQGDR